MVQTPFGDVRNLVQHCLPLGVAESVEPAQSVEPVEPAEPVEFAESGVRPKNLAADMSCL